jgi:stress-induced-phosphoprotein 1
VKQKLLSNVIVEPRRTYFVILSDMFFALFPTTAPNNVFQFKDKGNAALQSGNTSEAIENYTKAINLDGANHVYFSNRSAAYLKKGDAHNALEDANSCIGLNPGFAKGYSRKGAALHALKRYNDSISIYEEGLVKFPGDPGLSKGLDDVKKEKENPFGSRSGGDATGGLFSPQMIAQMALDPKLRPYLQDKEVMAKISLVQQNPSMLPTILQDAKMMELLGAMMGQDMKDDDVSASSSKSASNTPTSANNAEKMEVDEPEEDLSDLLPGEREIKENQKAAIKKKEEGNELYKSKKFEEALAAYNEAVVLDPTNVTFLNNIAAVLFTQKKYEECIENCLKAVEVGKEHRASFDDRAKALTRAAKAYQKMGNLGKAIEMCNLSQLESFDKETQRLLKNLELEKRKADASAYQDSAKAEEAKQRGNDFFRDQKYGEAVREYEDAVKRAPKNAAIRNNLAAALCKVMDFSGAQRQIDEALQIDPKYVKAWARKGDIEMYMKEFHKAQVSYGKGLELDKDNAACKEGLRKCTAAMTYGRQNMTDDEKKEQAAHAMADPEIQAIVTDPVIQQVLRDFGENPAAAQKALGDTVVRNKINKLIAAGILETA